MGRIRSALGLLLPGARERREQTRAYAAAWAEHNEFALEADGPLWVALGDSSAQGIGASAHDRGYVGRVHDLLRDQRDPAYRMINLSLTGALTDDVVELQVPALDALGEPVDLVTCGIGGNDIMRRRTDGIVAGFERLIDALPTGTVMANCPKGLGTRRTAAANAVISQRAPDRGILVADVFGHTGPPWTGKYAADRFHPNDLGYQEWVAAFAEALDLQT
jgi:lysophospholipase L1-like esterase